MKSPVPTTLTKGHIRLHDLLVTLGYLVEDEYPVGPYAIDCYVREAHCGFEFDGDPYHTPGKRRVHDQNRDAWILLEHGIPIKRVRQSDFSNNNALKLALDEFIEQHMDTYEERFVKHDSQRS